jgi:hypothetical protein
MWAKIVAKSVSQGRSCDGSISGMTNSLAQPQNDKLTRGGRW